MVRLQSASDDESLTSSDSNLGQVRWNKRSMNSNLNVSSINSFSNSLESLSESSSSSLSDNNSKKRISRQSQSSESNSDEIYQQFKSNKNRIELTKKPCTPKKLSDRSSDDSIIFAEAHIPESSENVDIKPTSEIKDSRKFSKSILKTRAKSQDNLIKKSERIKRQYIYIQVVFDKIRNFNI